MTNPYPVDPGGSSLLNDAISRLTSKQVKGRSKPNSFIDIIKDFANRRAVAGTPIKAGTYTGLNQSHGAQYTNPIWATLNDARDKLIQSDGLGLFPGISENNRDSMPNTIQGPWQAQPNQGAANAMDIINRATQQARAAMNTGMALRAGQSARDAATPSVGGLFGGLFGGITDVLNAATQSVTNAQNAPPSFPSGPWDNQPDPRNGANTGGYNINLPDTAAPEAPAPIELKRNDFSDQANKLVGEAYGPQYQAIDEAVTQAKKNSQNQDALLAGLYTQLVNSDKAAGKSVDARYQDAIKQADTNATTRQADAAAGYNSTAQKQAEMLKAMGMGDAADELLKQGVADSGWAQNLAKTGAQAQSDYLTGQNQAQQDYYTGIAGADTTTGLAARQQNGRDLQNLQSEYDQQRLNLAGQQSQDALNYGTTLSDQDFAAQQANYGVGQDAYQNALNSWQAQQSQALQQAQLQLQAQGMSSDDAYKWAQLQADQQKAKYEAEMAKYNDTYNRQRDQVADQHWQAGYDLDTTKYKTDAALNAAQLGQQNQPQGPDPTGDQTTIAQLTQAANGDSAKGGRAFSYIQSLVADPNNAQYVTSLPALIQAAQQGAQAAGLDPGLATTAAVAYWTNIYKGNGSK